MTTTKRDLEQESRDWAKSQSSEFMHVYTNHCHWQEIETTNEGTIVTPESDCEYPSNDDAAKSYDVEPDAVQTSFGWRARLSAPGYMDCTDWTGLHETEIGAVIELYEMYGE